MPSRTFYALVGTFILLVLLRFALLTFAAQTTETALEASCVPAVAGVLSCLLMAHVLEYPPAFMGWWPRKTRL